MAKILLGDGIGDKRGKQGGTVYSRNRYANYTRQKTIPVNPNSVKQSNVRASFGGIASGFRALSSVQINAWAALAAALAPTNVFGQTFSYTAFNVYMKANQDLAAAGLTMLSSPDVVPPVFPVQTSVVSLDVSDTEIDFSAQFDGNAITPADMRVVIQATPAVSANLSQASIAKLFRYLETSSSAYDFTTPLDLYSIWSAAFSLDGFIPGNTIWFRSKIISTTTGLSSPWLVNQGTIIA